MSLSTPQSTPESPSTTLAKRRSLRTFWVIVGLIAILMFSLRVSQISHGMPDVQMGDENSDLSVTARILTGQLPKVVSRYTRAVVSMIELVGFGGVYVENLLRTGNGSLSAYHDLFFAQRSDFLWASRLLIVIISTGALLALADLMRRVTNIYGGILAALLMCFNYYWNLNTIYAMPDTLIASAIVFYCWAVINMLQSGSRRAYALVGVTFAFVMLSKLSAGPIGLALAAAHIYRVWQQGGWHRFIQRLIWSDRVLITAVATLIANIALNPLAFVRLNDLVYEIQYRIGYGYGGVGRTNGVSKLPAFLVNHSLDVIQHYIGVPLLILFVLGIVGFALRRKPAGVVLFVAVLSIWVSTAVIDTIFYKPSYWIPVIPLVVMIASAGAVFVVEIMPRRVLRYAAVLIIVGLVANEAVLTLHVAAAMREPYTFMDAETYIEQHWPKDARILMGSTIAYSVPLQRDQASIERARSLGAAELQNWAWWLKQPESVRRYEYDIYGPELAKTVSSFDDVRKLIIDQHIDYVIEVDYCQGLPDTADSDSALTFPPLNNDLKQGFKLVGDYSPFVGGDTCPTTIYDRTTLLNRDELGLFYRPGAIVRLFEVDRPALTTAIF